MESEPPRPGTFHPKCTACAEGFGRPVSVTVREGQRTITYRCDRCARQWEETDESDAFLSRKPQG